MKISLLLLLLCLSLPFLSYCQEVELARHAKGAKAMEINVGLNRWGKFISTGFSRHFSNKIYGKLQIGFERGNYKSLLSFNRIFTDLGVYYSPLHWSNKLFINLLGGGTYYNTRITGFETSRGKYHNFGIMGGLELEYYLSNKLVLLATHKSKIFLDKEFGNMQFNSGLGVKYIF